MTEQYGMKNPIRQVGTSRGMEIFAHSFEQFKLRIRKNQSQKSTWKVTRWAVHDVKKFGALITQLRGFVDGLESTTKSFGFLEQQLDLLQQEVASLSDIGSLRLLRDATSSVETDVSDSASRRLQLVESASMAEIMTLATRTGTLSTEDSYHTAPRE